MNLLTTPLLPSPTLLSWFCLALKINTMADFVLELVDLQNILCGTFDLLSMHNAVHDKCVVMSAACRYHSTNIVICWWAKFHLWIMTSSGDNCSTTIHDTPSMFLGLFMENSFGIDKRQKCSLGDFSLHDRF